MKQRSLYDTYWADEKIKLLSCNAKLLMLYLLTSPHLNLIGIYHCPVAYISCDTGLSDNQSKACLSELEKHGLVYVYADYVVIANYVKHQKYAGSNLLAALKKSFTGLSDRVLAFALSKSAYALDLYHELFPDAIAPVFNETDAYAVPNITKRNNLAPAPVEISPQVGKLIELVESIKADIPTKQKCELQPCDFQSIIDRLGYDEAFVRIRVFYSWKFTLGTKPKHTDIGTIMANGGWVQKRAAEFVETKIDDPVKRVF